MKRTVIFLMAAIMAVIPSPNVSADNKDSIPIVIEQTTGLGDDPIFRAPALIPIQACYMPLLHAICFTFSYPMGTLVCRLENLDTNEGRYAKIFSDSGVATLPFLASPGHYRMALTTKNGQQYVGEFEVE